MCSLVYTNETEKNLANHEITTQVSQEATGKEDSEISDSNNTARGLPLKEHLDRFQKKRETRP